MKRTLLLLAIILLVAGCGTPWTPEAKLLAARESFNGTVNSLTVLRKAGTFTKAEGEELTMVIKLGQATLDEWQAAIELKHPTAGVIERFNYALRSMTAAKIGAERKAVE